MHLEKTIKIALVGNPNTGKTSLFNQLTGLNQKVGNYPGITVDKKIGSCHLSESVKALILDLPGTYSINATSADEHIVFDILVNDKNPDYPDAVVVVAEVENLKRNLFLFSQIKDLGLPTLLVINMIDQLERKGIQLNIDLLAKELKTIVIPISARKNIGIDELKKVLIDYKTLNTEPVADISEKVRGFFFEHIKDAFPNYSIYKSWLLITKEEVCDFITPDLQDKIKHFRFRDNKIKHFQHKETIYRYQVIHEILKKTYSVNRAKGTDLRGWLDRILTHKILGYIIFALALLLIFQSVYAWASIPMDWIDVTFARLADYTQKHLPQGTFNDLLTDGIIPGIGGILIFIPQIAILFFFVAILEETGYMSRVVFLMDKIMRRFGMSGKSVLPLVSGTACAIPAIMTARNIESWRERLITILVTPFVTCSARLPVYAILIALIIPEKSFLGVFNLQGLTLLGLYFLGFGAAFSSAALLHTVLKIKNKSFFIIELPNYQLPSLKNLGLTVWDKTKSFVLEAGKIILAISIVLWFLAAHGGKNFKNAEEIVTQNRAYMEKTLTLNQLQNQIDAYRLENSYLGNIGKAIEPVIKPLGYDWKIGIALISSFAAREVFVGTLATIYSVGDSSENVNTIKQRMQLEKNDEGKPVFNFATGISLLLFYAFAMQCMGTLAIVKRETNSWKWPLLQLFGMGALAYIVSLVAYQILR
jgi:ferrous iron transport protein B